jgi:nucleoside-diphosphate-sugar epimerase
MGGQRRVLITGIEGFTGRYLKGELEAYGWRVFGLGADKGTSDADYRRLDLADTQGMRAWIAEVQPDAVVHLAAIAFVGHGDAEAFYRVNLVGTRNLLAALADVAPSVGRVLLASSANIYGNAKDGALDEMSVPNPSNDYAVSKLAMEYLARLWFDRLPIVIVRPFNYTGVGQSESFLIPKIVAHFRRRAEGIELGNLDVWRDFSDVRALVEAYRRLLDAGPSGMVVNVCSGRTHSLREVLGMAEAITGYHMPVRVNPAFVRANEVRTLRGDPTRLRGLIGAWDNPPFDETLQWMLNA